jgi:hypothetical protein
VLSVAVERATNAFKLRHPELRVESLSKEVEKVREQRITSRSLVLGVVLAVIAKANFFEIVTHLDAPWETLGWAHASGSQWFRDPATMSWGSFLYALGGSAITGIALGFGSKFWHDTLDSVLELKGIARGASQKRKAEAERVTKATLKEFEN